MKLTQCIRILRAHNKWRRGGNGKQTDPRKLGIAIDVIADHFAQTCTANGKRTAKRKE